jgi:hypothetical protein
MSQPVPVPMLLTCLAVRWVSDQPWPGWVEVQFTDADGHRWSVVDKPAVFDAGQRLIPHTAYPIQIGLACQAVHQATRPDGDQVVMVELLHGCQGAPTPAHPGQGPDLQLHAGQTRFQVRADQLRTA